MPDQNLIIDLLRHGETEAGGRFIGSTDVALNDNGFRQMQWVDGNRYDRVISSPLIRCADFAESICEQPGYENDLREIHFGSWENRSSEEIWQTNQQQLASFWDDPLENTPPNAETLVDFHARTSRVWAQLIDNPAGAHYLLITHSGVIRSLLSLVLDLPLMHLQRLQIDHGGLSRVQISYSATRVYYRVLFINRRSQADMV